MRIVCLSDTHNCNERIIVPDGDLLIHSGDATTVGSAEQIFRFNKWFTALPHQRKIFVAGNHDCLFETDNERARSILDDSIDYLQDSTVVVGGLKIYGSPWQPRFFDWAFNLQRGPEMAAKWRLIPDDVEILVTHGPPHGILDTVPRAFGFENAGCEELRKRVDELLENGRLKLHVFGHIHFGHGSEIHGGGQFVNAATCNDDYLPTNQPIVIDI
ncbi:MAG: metallophosphatase domain-containing protein [Acidobacteriota bacterium]